MNENKNKREWVKTFAIIFLSVLLVLTFFSNTIMNMTLPEVSTDYISYGTIKTQVRGSGTVVANDNYSVRSEISKQIAKVMVRSGDRVEKGDILFVLAEGESAELTDARNNYETLNYEYQTLLLDLGGTGSAGEHSKVIATVNKEIATLRAALGSNGSNSASIDTLEAKIKAKQKEISSLSKEISRLEAEMNTIGYTPTEYEVLTGKISNVTEEQYINATTDVENAKLAEEKAKEVYDEAVKKREDAEEKYNLIKSDGVTSEIQSLEESIKQAERNIEDLEKSLKYLKQEFYDATNDSTLEKLYDTFKDKQKAWRHARDFYDSLVESGTATEEELNAAKNEYLTAGYAVDVAYDNYKELLTAEERESISEEKQLDEAETRLKRALEDLNVLRDKLAKKKQEYGEKITGEISLEAAETELANAKNAEKTAKLSYEEATEKRELLEKTLDKTRNGYKLAKVREYEALIEGKETALEKLNDELDDLNENLADLKDGGYENEETMREEIKSLSLGILNLDKKLKERDEALRKVTELEEKVVSNNIVAPVSGSIDTVFVTSGQKITPDEVLAEISLAEQGFKMTMTATAEQAAKLRLGNKAEITGYVPYGSKIDVTLAAIKTDIANPGSRQKILEFTVEGDVNPGQTLSIAVGDKNASYDYTVPNTAIREDSEGKYVLVVESKSTPISTRYIARRVNVNVTASDDLRSAITGEFDNYSYVIATSTKPINAGEQVKLVEN